MTNLSLGQVSRLLAIPPHRISYAHSINALPQPKRFAGKRMYTEVDVRRIAAYFAKDQDAGAEHQKGTECSSTSLSS